MAIDRFDLAKLGFARLLGQRQQGATAPNPAVGCVIVDSNQRVIGYGATGDGGQPHAEAQALARIEKSESAVNATAYVTLEPCAGYSRTPPCAQALIESGITRVVIGIADPVQAGNGIACLREAGVVVDLLNVDSPTFTDLVDDFAGFLCHRLDARPMVTAKLALSIDGKIAPAGGGRFAFSTPKVKHYTDGVRFRHDAILTSSTTWRDDQPRLRVGWHPGRQPRRFIFGTLSEPEIAAAAEGFTYLSRASFADCGSMLAFLAQSGITSLLIEAGASLTSRLIQQGLVDRLLVVSAPVVLGDTGLSAFITPVADAGRLKPWQRVTIDDCVLTFYDLGLQDRLNRHLQPLYDKS